MRKLLAALLLVLTGCPLTFAQQAARNEVFDNLTARSNLTASSLNGILWVGPAPFKYTTIEAAIAACPASPNACQISIADGFTETTLGFTLGVSPCVNYYGLSLSVGANVTITQNGKITLLCGAHIKGANVDSSLFIAGGSFPANTPMFEVGNNVNLLDASIENVRINASSIAGSSYIRARGINENSRFRDLTLQNARSTGGTGAGILIDGTSVNTAHWLLDNLNFGQLNNTDAGDCIGILNGVGGGKISRVSCVSSAGSPISGAVVHISGTLGFGDCDQFGSLYGEKLTDVLLFDNSNGVCVVADSLGAGARTINTLRITATARGQVFARMLRNNANGACPALSCLVNNQNASTPTKIAATNPPAPFGFLSRYFFDDSFGDEWLDFSGSHYNPISSAKAFVSGAAIQAPRYQTRTNCSVNSVSPAACGSATSGAFVVPTTTATYTVNTTQVTAASRIFLFPMSFAGNLPSAPTCVAPAVTSAPTISAISAGASFTFALPSTRGQTCWQYWIVN